MSSDDETLHDLLLVCPQSAEEMAIAEVETDEDKGLTYIYTQGVSAKWKHTIKTEEV